jgi:hypothetical protein
MAEPCSARAGVKASRSFVQSCNQSTAKSLLSAPAARFRPDAAGWFALRSVCRLWAATADPESYRPLPLTLLTPLRTLRGHGEAVTCLQLISGSTGAHEVSADGELCCLDLLWLKFSPRCLDHGCTLLVTCLLIFPCKLPQPCV